MEQDQLVKIALFGGAAYLVWQYLQTQQAAVSQPLTTIANGAGVTVSSQATAVQTAPILPGVVTAPPASQTMTASALEQKAAQNGYPAPQMFTVWEWNYFYGLMTGSGTLPDPAQVLPGVNNPNSVKISSQQYAQGMSNIGLPVGLGSTAVNQSYVRKAIQGRGMAPIHGWE